MYQLAFSFSVYLLLPLYVYRSVLDRNITLSALLTRGSLLSTTTPSPDTVGTGIGIGTGTTAGAAAGLVGVGANKSKRDHAPRSILLYYAKSISDYEQVGVYICIHEYYISIFHNIRVYYQYKYTYALCLILVRRSFMR